MLIPLVLGAGAGRRTKALSMQEDVARWASKAYYPSRLALGFLLEETSASVEVCHWHSYPEKNKQTQTIKATDIGWGEKEKITRETLSLCPKKNPWIL